MCVRVCSLGCVSVCVHVHFTINKLYNTTYTCHCFWRGVVVVFLFFLQTIVYVVLSLYQLKSEEYWPSSPSYPVQYGEVVVTMISASVMPVYSVRKFTVCMVSKRMSASKWIITGVRVCLCKRALCSDNKNFRRRKALRQFCRLYKINLAEAYPHKASFSFWGCWNQTAVPIVLISCAYFVSTSSFTCISF